MPPSHLTRLIFRRLIANEPIFHHGCRQLAARRPRLLLRDGAQLQPQAQRRTFFEIFKQQRKLKPLETPSGLEVMVSLTRAMADNLRPPTPKDVADAFLAFFSGRKGKFEDFHIIHAQVALRYLVENPREDGQPWFTKTQLDKFFFVKMLRRERLPNNAGAAHIAFGRMILDELARPLNTESTTVDQETEGEDKNFSEHHIRMRLLQLLSKCGAAMEARTIALEHFPFDAQAKPAQRSTYSKAWKYVLAGLAREGNVQNMLDTDHVVQERLLPLTTDMQKEFVQFYAEQKDLEKAKFWYSQPVISATGVASARALSSTSAALLKACAIGGDLSYGQQVVTALLADEMPEKESWDAIFLWSAAVGKGVDEVDRMMSVLIRRNDEIRQQNGSKVIRPDTDTINTLVEMAMLRQDPYTAERYITLGEKRGISPDERTFSLQIEYRISVRDVDGARAAYFNLQGCFSGAPESVAVINKLIRVLCVSTQHHFDELMSMVDHLHERKAEFDPETVAALLLLHLRRGEIHDAMDLLQVHSAQYSPSQRTVIQKALMVFILDGTTSTADAWDGYQILRNVFAETGREDRILIMNEFFARSRSDMACHVFFHMRNHPSPAHAADHAVYVAAFTGFARCADAESLELAHNQLKLDFTVEIDTKLRNALMLAYASVGENMKALQFWREICESKEGPSYASISIAFRSCEAMHLGRERAAGIWERLKEQDVEIGKDIWIGYMCAVASNHRHDEAQHLIETVTEEYGWELDLEILAAWFNSTRNSEKQKHVESWIRRRYPAVWAQMEAAGHWVALDGFGWRQYNIERKLEP